MFEAMAAAANHHDTEDYGLTIVQDVIRLFDHLKIEKAHVVGYSMGGLITMKLATENPNRMLSACICAAGWLRPNQEEAPEFIAAVAKVQSRQRAAASS